jgi:hypothetical protein
MIQIKLMSTTEEMSVFLHGGLVGGVKIGQAFVHNLTLVFTQPAAVTVTFNAGAAQAPLTLSQIIAQINGTVGLAGVARAFDGRLHLEEQTPTNGVAIANTSTAGPLLGFGDDGQTGAVINPFDGVAPRLLQLTTSPSLRSAYILVLEV